MKGTCLPKALGNQFNDQFIKERLSYYYNGQNRYEVFTDNMGRDLIKQEIKDKGGNSCFFFILSGSPLKGYAIWNKGHHTLLIIDAWLEVKKKYVYPYNRSSTIEYMGDKELPFKFDYPKKYIEKH